MEHSRPQETRSRCPSHSPHQLHLLCCLVKPPQPLSCEPELLWLQWPPSTENKGQSCHHGPQATSDPTSSHSPRQLLQPHWPPHCISNHGQDTPPRGPFNHCSLCMDASPRCQHGSTTGFELLKVLCPNITVSMRPSLLSLRATHCHTCALCPHPCLPSLAFTTPLAYWFTICPPAYPNASCIRTGPLRLVPS